jgi:hypothetical protein
MWELAYPEKGSGKTGPPDGETYQAGFVLLGSLPKPLMLVAVGYFLGQCRLPQTPWWHWQAFPSP